MKIRTIKRTAPGRIPRKKVRDAVRAVHVLEKDSNSWEVRTLGPRGESEVFTEKERAVHHAFRLKPEAKVFIHHRRPKEVTEAKPGRRAKKYREVRLQQ